MTEAVTTSTTPNAAMPPLIDLGRLHRAACVEKALHDRPPSTAAFERADAEARAIAGLMFTRPIVTLADAAALAVQGHALAEACNCGESEDAGLDKDIEKMRWAFARLAMMLAPAARIPADQLGSDNDWQCIARDATGGEIRA